MKKILFLSMIFFFLQLIYVPLWAQKEKKDRKDKKEQKVKNKAKKGDKEAQEFEKGDKVELLGADGLEGFQKNGVEIRKLIGNVSFKQNDTYVYCDSAYFYAETNSVDAFGHVRLNQKDSLTMTSNKLFYSGDDRRIEARGDVFLKDPSMTLKTEALNYELNTGIAYYFGGGEIIDDQNKLTSQSGSYDTNAKYFFFKDDVELINQADNYELHSDTLQYNTISKIAYFKGPTEVKSTDGTLLAKDGEYNTVTRQSSYRGGSMIENEQYILKGDNLDYDERNQIGVAKGHAQIILKKDSIVIDGDIGRFWGKDGISKMTGNAVMRNISQNDTLYLSADTLLAINKKEISQKTAVSDTLVKGNTPPKNKLLIAYPQTKIFRKDLQAICDSLVYNLGDSTIYFFRDPVLWNDKSQISSDSIFIQMAYNKIDKMHMRQNSFVISQDTLLNFNQVKGRNMIAYFKEKQIHRVNVSGNGESIYFALENDTILTGMNKVICSDINLVFKANKINRISFINKPDALFIPPHELTEDQKKLKGFKWRTEEKPTKEMVLNRSKYITDVPKETNMKNANTKKTKLIKEPL